ncbi:TM2 domain-containing protein [Chloroflexota bacterium]
MEVKNQQQSSPSTRFQWRISIAKILGWLSVIWGVSAFLVSTQAARIALALPAESSEWGRYGAFGGMILLTWLVPVVVLVFALVAGVAAIILVRSGSRLTPGWKRFLIVIGILGALIIINIILFDIAYNTMILNQPLRWFIETVPDLLVGDVRLEVISCLVMTVGLAMLLTVLTTSRPSKRTWDSESIDEGAASNKSRLFASLFALFLGTLGAHRFYIGKKGTATVILALTALAVVSIPRPLTDWIPFTSWIYFVTGSFGDLVIALPIVEQIVEQNAHQNYSSYEFITSFCDSPFFLAAIVWALFDFFIIASGNMRESRGKLITNW